MGSAVEAGPWGITVNCLNPSRDMQRYEHVFDAVRCRDLSNRPGQDPSSSPRPSGRHQIPRDSLQGHAPCYDEDRTRGGTPGTVLWVSRVNFHLSGCVCCILNLTRCLLYSQLACDSSALLVYAKC